MNRPLIVVIVGAVVVFVALGLTWLVGLRESVPDAPPPVTADVSPDPSQQTQAAGPITGTTATEGKAAMSADPDSEAADMDTGAAAGSASSGPGPSFDVVRVDRDGNTVMAGRAAPETEVVIRDGEMELGRVQADERGEWVFLPSEPLPPGSRELRLGAVGPGGEEVAAEESVVLVVPDKDGDDDRPPLAVETAPGRPSRVLQAPAPAVAGGSPGEAPLPPAGADAATPSVIIDVVDYDADGNLSFGGRAAPGATVFAYVDNRFIGKVTAGPDGRWSVTVAEPVATGRHTLRADVMGAEEKEVAARAEIPFLRPEGESPPAAGTRVMVQPGNSLWRIARQTLGAGTAYTVIYEANRAQIRDPDLIYPGQVFVIPAEVGE